MSDPLELYKEYFVDRDFERQGLFQLLAEQCRVERALYPGSFVHVTPSFVFPVVTYVDTDKRTLKFFENPGLMDFIAKWKIYPQSPKITFHPVDYRNPIDEENKSYDLLISQYAGFVSQHCKQYLKINGYLLVNNSHGDASMASIDRDYELMAVIHHQNGHYQMSKKNLDTYFVPKKAIQVTKDFLEKTQKGIGYKKVAYSYLFQRVN